MLKFMLLLICVICFVNKINCLLDRHKNFQVYWNVPSEDCQKFNISFDGLYEKYGIIQNTKDKFYYGDKVSILYDPGSFPALKNDHGKDIDRNGNVPQRGDLKLHLEEFMKSVDKIIPNPRFSGIAIIDFETYPLFFDELYGKYGIYRQLSINIEKEKDGKANKRTLEEKAKNKFEKYVRLFVEETLSLAKVIRPHASWGYYGYPRCKQWSNRVGEEECIRLYKDKNDKLSSLFNETSLLLPSVYLYGKQMNLQQRLGLIRSKVREAVRVAQKLPDNVKVLPYYWYRYRESSTPINKEETNYYLQTIVKNNADGVIIWGHRDDMNDKNKCSNFYNYVHEILGPLIVEIKTSIRNSGVALERRSQAISDNNKIVRWWFDFLRSIDNES